MNTIKLPTLEPERADEILKEFGSDAELNKDGSVTITTDLDMNYIFLKAIHAGIEIGMNVALKLTR